MRKRIDRCGHMVLECIKIAEDPEGVYKKGICSDCGAVVVQRYTLLTMVVYGRKGNQICRY